MSPFSLVSILENALFLGQPKGWTPNRSQSFSATSGCLSLETSPVGDHRACGHRAPEQCEKCGLSIFVLRGVPLVRIIPSCSTHLC
jgi:hypothetical protein